MGSTNHKTADGFKQKLLSGIIWRGLNVLFAFVFNALLVSELGAGASGHFFYLLNNLFFAVLFLSIGLESGISYYNARKEMSISFLFTISIIWSAAGAAVFFVVVYFLPTGTIDYSSLGLYLTLYVLGSMITTFLSAIYFTNHNSKTPNLVAAITNLMLIALLPKMPWINNKIDIYTYFAIYLCSPFFSAVILIALMQLQKIFFTFKNFSLTSVKPLLIFSFHSFVISLLFNCLKRSDYWFVNKWCVPEDAGNYFQASKIIQLLLLLPALASFSLYPLIVQAIKQDDNEQQSEKAAIKVMQLTGTYFFIALLLGLGIGALGYWVFPLLYGSTFNNLYTVTLYLLPGLIFFAATYPLTTYFSGKNQNKTTILFLAVSIACLVLCNVILTPQYFIYGAAISNTISNCVYFLLLIRRFLLQNKLSINNKEFYVAFNINLILKNLQKITWMS